MRPTLLAIRRYLVVAAVVASCAGCDREPSAAAGARSVVGQPVGPVPGVGDIPPVANPLDDRAARVEGRKLFVRYNCYGCHGGRAGGGMGPSLRDGDWLYGSTPDRIFNSIAEGRGHGMPSWGGRLPDQQIWQLTAYISSLRTPDEPEAPK
ncbi:MAG TPA: c-type cytochrome [Polyangia bacterium]|jgi:cytochrome c oxidase cbb3-type subunit 3|nr:c-type cytochrome [Polyangia bacterium]HWE27439.1 c-type cytochrome [Polyangia bacterium]